MSDLITCSCGHPYADHDLAGNMVLDDPTHRNGKNWICAAGRHHEREALRAELAKVTAELASSERISEGRRQSRDEYLMREGSALTDRDAALSLLAEAHAIIDMSWQQDSVMPDIVAAWHERRRAFNDACLELLNKKA